MLEKIELAKSTNSSRNSEQQTYGPVSHITILVRHENIHTGCLIGVSRLPEIVCPNYIWTLAKKRGTCLPRVLLGWDPSQRIRYLRADETARAS